MRLPNTRIGDFFYRAYHAWPQFYGSITQLLSIGQWEKWQNRVFDDLTGKNILEIGVGPGKLLLRIAKKGYNVTGIELRKGMAYEARRKLRQAGYEVDILQQSVYQLPFKNETFDCVVLTFVLGEINQLDKAVGEMKRVLRPGGKVIVIAGGMPQDKNLFARILFRLAAAHTTLHLERDNVKFFREHGFSVKRHDFGPFNIVNKIVAVKQ